MNEDEKKAFYRQLMEELAICDQEHGKWELECPCEFEDSIICTLIKKSDMKRLEQMLQAGVQQQSLDLALSVALDYGELPFMERLAAAGANLRQHDRHNLRRGLTASAARNNNIIAIKWLLEKGANIDEQDIFGWTPLMHAAWLGHASALQCLLEAGADASIANKHGQTALSLALKAGNGAFLRILPPQPGNHE